MEFWKLRNFILINIILLFSLSSDSKTEYIKSAPTGGNFTLKSLNGEYSLSQSRGKVVLIYFGFTSCPDVCPTTLGNVTRAFKSLSSDELRNVQALFISIDPQRDNLKKIQQYSSHFHPQILALTGNEIELKKTVSLYGAFFRKVKVSSAMEYTMDHSTGVFVINTEGKWVDTIPHNASAKEFLVAIRNAFGVKN